MKLPGQITMRVLLTDGAIIDINVPDTINPQAIPAMILTGTDEHGETMWASGRYAVRWWVGP